ncbi:MAG: ATP phosphoribosyltransferase regulatory subunit [Lachnospiraceae bacterium]|nr:ATP phosphoribosyltransferase regulatory subunit [Lachnospiraceae bacterium]
MTNKLIHTPEGVRDIYDAECRQKLKVQEKILNTLYLYGYQHIETPSFEFFDIFNEERGSVSSREMFKFFDRDNRTLVLKPDMTPAIARCVAKYFSEETMPLRLCYLERTFTNNTSYQGRLKESTQTGAEMIGDDSSDGDAEMIAMVIDSLKAAGLREFQVELGQVEFYRGLVEEAGMDEETQETLRDFIENKNFFGVEELLNANPVKPELKEVFLRLPELFGSMEQIRAVRSLTDNRRALAAIDRLEEVYKILENYGLAEYVSFDLGMLSKYQYYTGIIFKAYTYGTGDYVVTGGRYDKLLQQFGKEAPAVGFGIVVDRLMMALASQGITLEVEKADAMILFDVSARVPALALAKKFREEKHPVLFQQKAPSLPVEAYQRMAGRSGLTQVLYVSGDGSQVETCPVQPEKCCEEYAGAERAGDGRTR